MSFTQAPTRRTRLQRSELAVPGSNPAMFEKALLSNADYIFLDCEDAVAPNNRARPTPAGNIRDPFGVVDRCPRHGKIFVILSNASCSIAAKLRPMVLAVCIAIRGSILRFGG